MNAKTTAALPASSPEHARRETLLLNLREATRLCHAAAIGIFGSRAVYDTPEEIRVVNSTTFDVKFSSTEAATEIAAFLERTYATTYEPLSATLVDDFGGRTVRISF